MSSHERAHHDEANNVTYQRCQYAYEWCIPMITGKKVLDTGCGLGYGAADMAEHASEIVGIDYDAETIEANKKEYAGIKNLSFVQGSIPPLPLTLLRLSQIGDDAIRAGRRHPSRRSSPG